MTSFTRRIGLAGAATVLATGLVAPTALAAADRQQATPARCLALLNAGFDAGSTIVAPRTPLIAETTPLVNRACYSMRVSIAISKTDHSGVRTQLARRSSYEQNAYLFRTVFSSLPGTWMVRQIAVGNASGQVAIKKYDTTPAPVRAISESQLTGRPTGVIPLDPGRGVFVHGYLKAYSRFGTWTTLAAGQNVVMQARPHGSTGGYTNVDVTKTSASGYWRAFWEAPAAQTWDIRVAYITAYQSVASDWTWLGVTRLNP